MPGPGQCKICKCPTPGTDKAGECPAVALEGGGGLGTAGIDWCIIGKIEQNEVDFRDTAPLSFNEFIDQTKTGMRNFIYSKELEKSSIL